MLCVCVRNEDIREVLWPAERLLRDLEAAAPGRFALGVLSDTAEAGGGSRLHDPEDMGFMYSRAFADIDGNGWGVLHMDAAAT